jgi:acyl-CoA reductase-like NAD-dependent aldehyde dehydrogenase
MTLAPETPVPVDETRSGAVDTFASVDPANGQVLATYPVHSAEDVAQAVARAREATLWWQAQGWEGRRRHLRAWKGVLARRVRDVEEALQLTNATSYGLAGAVFTKSRKRGIAIAERMRSGMTSVNSVVAFAAVPSLPFGGVGDSGFGRIQGQDGLEEFTRAQAITAQRFALPTPLLSFKRHRQLTDHLAKVIGLVPGRS